MIFRKYNKWFLVGCNISFKIGFISENCREKIHWTTLNLLQPLWDNSLRTVTQIKMLILVCCLMAIYFILARNIIEQLEINEI